MLDGEWLSLQKLLRCFSHYADEYQRYAKDAYVDLGWRKARRLRQQKLKKIKKLWAKNPSLALLIVKMWLCEKKRSKVCRISELLKNSFIRKQHLFWSKICLCIGTFHNYMYTWTKTQSNFIRKSFHIK